MIMAGPGFKLDLHNHTRSSSDGVHTPEELLIQARARGIDCVAVTDHNTVRGGLEALSLAQADPKLPRVIPGVELLTDVGEIIGLFIQEEIPARLPVAEAAERIKSQGGLIYLPHPFDRVRRGAVISQERQRVAALADIIEVMNGRALHPRAGRRSRVLASELGKPWGAGSDAHRPQEVGTAYVVVTEIPTRDTLLALVAAGRVEHSLRPPDYLLNWGRMGLAPITRWRRGRSG